MKNRIKRITEIKKQKLMWFTRYILVKLHMAHPKHLLSIAGITVVALLIAHAVSFVSPANVQFSYSGGNCFFNPVLLPKTINIHPSQSFSVTYKNNLELGDLHIYSATTCLDLTNLPSPDSKERITLGSLIKKSIEVNVGSYAMVNSLVKEDVPISPIKDIEFDFSGDQFLDYQLVIDKKSVLCQKTDIKIICSIESFNLAQTKSYKLKLQRLFRGVFIEDILSQQFKTTSAIKVTGASLKNGSKVYNKPKGLSIRFDKAISKVGEVKLELLKGKTYKKIPQTLSFKDKKLNTKFIHYLPRLATFRLTISSVEATDNGFLDKPFVLKFSTSGGPRVVSSSIPTSPGSSFRLTFDSSFAQKQKLQSFFVVEKGGQRVSVNVSLSGKTVTIRPSGDLPKCTNFTVKVIDGIKSKYGVSGGSGWQVTSRTLCRSVISIGTSVQGRSILAYKYGNGPKKVIFVGAIHGNEQSSTYLLNSLISYLDNNPWQVPSDHTVIIIPIANPDGYAANSRCNSRGVDLNRNFPTGDWKSDVNSPGCSYGGPSSLSEPESRALAGYISSQGARIVLSYHAVAGIVAANEAGNSLALAHLYGQKSGYPSYGNEADDSYFDYDTTGAFENWMGERGIPGILIELRSNYGNEFYTHLDAILAMIKS